MRPQKVTKPAKSFTFVRYLVTYQLKVPTSNGKLKTLGPVRTTKVDSSLTEVSKDTIAALMEAKYRELSIRLSREDLKQIRVDVRSVVAAVPESEAKELEVFVPPPAAPRHEPWRTGRQS